MSIKDVAEKANISIDKMINGPTDLETTVYFRFLCCSVPGVRSLSDLKERARKGRKLCKSCASRAANQRRAETIKDAENGKISAKRKVTANISDWQPMRPRIIKDAGIEIKGIADGGLHPTKTAYVVKYLCCGKLGVISDYQVMNRIRKGITRCNDCSRIDRAKERKMRRVMDQLRAENALKERDWWPPTPLSLELPRHWINTK